VTLVINQAVGCHYVLPGPQLPSQLQSVTDLGRYQFILLGEQRQMCTTTCLGPLHDSGWPVIDHASSWSLIHCATYCAMCDKVE